jgi:TorA maturation chaperone TorD
MNEADIDLDLSRALLYELLKTCLYPPTSHGREVHAGGEGRRALEHAAAVVERETGAVPAALENLLPASAAGPAAELEPDYQRLFGHTAQGRVSPYETEYGLDGLFRQSQELADIGGFYRAFGLTVAGGSRERSDHLGVECEFLGFLCRKEAYHLLSGDREVAKEVREAERLFLKEHVSGFAGAFARCLSSEAGHPFYRALGDLLSAFLAVECRRLEVAPGPEFVPLRSTAEEEVPMACGSCRLAEFAGEASFPSGTGEDP